VSPEEELFSRHKTCYIVFLLNLKNKQIEGIFSIKFTAFIAHISCKVSSNILYTALLLQRGIIKAHLHVTLCSALRVIQKHATRLWRVERWKIKKIFLFNNLIFICNILIFIFNNFIFIWYKIIYVLYFIFFETHIFKW